MASGRCLSPWGRDQFPLDTSKSQFFLPPFHHAMEVEMTFTLAPSKTRSQITTQSVLGKNKLSVSSSLSS